MLNRDKILAWMQEHPDEEHQSSTVVAATSIPPASVSSLLAKLAREGRIAKVKLGKYIYHSDPAVQPAPTDEVAKRRKAKGATKKTAKRATKKTTKRVAAAGSARQTVKAKQGPLTLSFVVEHRLSDTETLVRSTDASDDAHYFVLRGVNI